MATKATVSAEFRNWRNMRDLRQFDKSTPTYWIALIKGFSIKGFDRDFIRPAIDFSQANSKCSRGVWYYWHLADGAYEGQFDANFKRQYFIVQSGEIRYCEKEDIEEWINTILG